MPFTVEEFHDLVRLLEQVPRAAKRTSPPCAYRPAACPAGAGGRVAGVHRERFQALAAAQQRTEERLTGLTTAQQHLAERLTGLATAQQHLAESLTALAAAQQRTQDQVTTVSAQLEDLVQVVRTLSTDFGDVKGKSLEWEYRTRVFAYFSRIVRRAHALLSDELMTLLEDAIDRGMLSDEQAEEISLADVIVRGRRRSDGVEVFLVVEVSWGVVPHDVVRAIRRACRSARTGTPALPVVAGTWVTPDAADLARTQQVWQVTNGHAVRPE